MGLAIWEETMINIFGGKRDFKRPHINEDMKTYDLLSPSTMKFDKNYRNNKQVAIKIFNSQI